MTFFRTRLLPAASIFAMLAAAACSSATDTLEPGDDTQEAPLNESKALGMTDVTILYPIPKTIDFMDDMLGPTSEIDQGELLPADVFAQLASIQAPQMLTFDGKTVDPQKPLFNDWADSFPLLRVVGIRLDPCFGATPTGLGANDCMNTIRLTLQFFNNGMNTVLDGRTAIHLFYKISRADFTALAQGMLELRKASGLPLQKGLMGTTRGVHPTLNAEGLRGPYATGLKNLILKYAGERTLTQIAFCVQDRGAILNGYYNGNVADSRWVFGRFEYRAGSLYQMDIASTSYTGLQTVDSAPFNPNRDLVVVSPAPVVQDSFLQFFNRKPEPDGKLDQAKLDRARKGSFALQNPTKYTAKNADCASCHMAKQAEPNHKSDPNDYKSYTYRLDHTHDAIGPFRMFGYDSGNQAVIAARVVNETAVVLDYLNKFVMK